MADNWLRKAAVEAIGTFMLVFVTVLTLGVGQLATLTVFTYGFVVAGLVAALGHVSGGHFNPAITLAMLLGKKIDAVGAVTYWVAQFAGGALGALVVWACTSRQAVEVATPVVDEELITLTGGVVLEALATFLLVLVFFGTVVDERSPISAYPFAIGVTVLAAHAPLLPLTRGSLNPARGFGPALVSGEWGGLAAWLAGPLIGAVLAWAFYRFVVAERRRLDPEDHNVPGGSRPPQPPSEPKPPKPPSEPKPPREQKTDEPKPSHEPKPPRERKRLLPDRVRRPKPTFPEPVPPPGTSLMS
jgi:MIP family channel proteins